MAHSHTKLLYHCIFSTKERRSYIDESLQPRLYGYLGGIAKNHRAFLLAAGGTANHIHLLLELRADMAIAEMMRITKSVSSKWVHETFSEHRSFAWQTGYGGFTVSKSGVPDVMEYIHNQEAHHKSTSFEDEYLAFLRRHGVEYDERFVFD